MMRNGFIIFIITFCLAIFPSHGQTLGEPFEKPGYEVLCEDIECICPRYPNDTVVKCSNKDMKMLPLDILFPPTVYKANFRNNHIEKVFSESFIRGQGLELIDLSHNNIDFIANYAFSKFSHLKTLLIASNRVWNLQEGIFLNLNQLQYLDLRRNKIQSFSSLIFQPLVNLRELRLDFNPLISVSAYSFQYLPSLQFLYLKKTKLKDIPSKLFLNNTELLNIILSGNNLTEVPVTALKYVPQLKYLDISANPIREINPFAFSELSTLEKLFLEHMNEFIMIHQFAFYGICQLKELHCSFNPSLRSIHVNAFRMKDTKEAIRVENLYLHHNGLTTLSEHLLRWGELKHLDLAGNPWTCDCHLSWIATEKLQRSVKERMSSRIRTSYFGYIAIWIVSKSMDSELFRKMAKAV
ncbi:uncharacterized protein LOC143238571 isoform X2 [Tachypleus tridentatus]|uniref:uncharacterized protein LOC143238571 isoform X2 n=1 Tax=Tachypleus tridentatus TaxID=6853 RepID=UPI003FD3CA16